MRSQAEPEAIVTSLNAKERWSLAAVRRKASVWRLLPVTDRLLILEAAAWLGAARLALALLPYERYAWWLRLGIGRQSADAALAGRIGRAVETAARNVPWRAVCLPQAMAGKALLARHGRSSTLCVGVVASTSGSLLLHAWLEADGRLVTGGPRPAAIPVVRYE